MRAVKMILVMVSVLGCLVAAEEVSQNVLSPVSGNSVEVKQMQVMAKPSLGNATGLSMHLRSQTALGLGSTFGYKLGQYELLGGLQYIKKSLAAAGESIDMVGWGPSVGAKYYFYDNPDRQIAAYIGGDVGKAFIHFSSSYDDFNTTIKDVGLGNVQAWFYDVVIGGEYFVNTQKSFSISTEIGLKSLEVCINNIKNIEGLNAVDLYDAETYGAIGLNYYF